MQGFHSEERRDKHFEYCKDNKAVRREMPKEGSFVELHDGKNKFKVSFIMYGDLEAILKQTEENVKSNSNPKESYTKEINQHIPSGLGEYSKFAYGEVEIH